ncbi:hypothetical protein [Sphingomonas hankookensis]|uniref:GNAT family N-acetyltransferase n=1 Tax=Sphingomonas hengshuiensis TaxID=1609977 RepID=A0A2W4Z881_9SPHN|nr:MAG: hypothetical protein DI632_10300 [Sphingomonas hengshuiensis]
MPALWRPAIPADAAAIASLARAELGDYGEAADLYAERIALAPGGCWVLSGGDADAPPRQEEAGDGAEHEGASGRPPAVLGHCISHPWHRFAPPAMHRLLGDLPPDADCWYLHDVVVAPAGRGSRAVERLLPILADAAARRRIPILALVAVGGADAYWARQGFFAAPGAAEGFGADAVYMERPATR